MNLRTLRLLEYNKIVEQLTAYAASPMAKRKCARLKPRKDIDMIRRLQQETRDALIRLNTQGELSFAGLSDIGASIKRLEVHGALDIKELLDIASVLDTTFTARTYGTEEGKDAAHDCLYERFSELVPLESLSFEIHRCILSETEIADDASSGLKAVRRDKRLLNERLHSQLNKLVSDQNKQIMFQENLVTMRNGRYCIPVKQEYKNRFPGMIHDQSASGNTVFIEPLAVVKLNNELKELDNRELAEIEKILEHLSEQAAAEYETIKYNFETLAELDVIFARAKFARAYKGTEPIFNEDGVIEIRQGRHPLLDKHTVVPVDIRLGDDYRLLIVTGPNTGGKTVSLKTLGLFALMGQSGLHIPALEGSRLSVFDDVFADIGDEQSIEQNLSTFSSHMSNVVYIMNHVTERSLCLFDELGGGTDPAEGAALAIAILSELNDRNIRCMATTHYSELKLFAMSTPGVQNASCEFDLATLMPTYRLIIGIPGKSNAFAISKKLGLSDAILDRARETIDSSKIDFETLLAELEASRKESEQEKAEILRLKEDTKQLHERAQAKDEELSAKKAQILADAREEAAELLEKAKQAADDAIKKYNKWSMNPHQTSAKEMEEERRKLRTKLDDYRKLAPTARQSLTSHHLPSDFNAGDTVHVISMDTTGTVLAPADSKERIKVQMGILTSLLPASDLVILDTPKQPGKQQTVISNKRGMSGALSIQPELNVIGMTVAEATSLIDRYLDDAMLSNLHKVTIIHGKGTGALRKGIHEFLKKQSCVKSFRLGAYGEGEAGVTIVEL